MATHHRLLHGLVATAVEARLNTLLNRNPAKTELLAPLADRMIGLQLEPFGGLFYLCVTTDDIKVLAETTATADVSVTGTMAAYASLGLSRDSRLDPAASGLKVAGDPALTAAVLHLLAQIDLSLLPAQTASRVPAVTTPTPVSDSLSGPLSAVSGWLDAGMDWGQTVNRTLQQNLAEYWQEESRELPGNGEIAVFEQDISQLEQRTAQCEQRIERLMAARDAGKRD